jgi:hypothetical protein
MLELRQAVAADAAAVRALTRAAYAKWVPLIGRTGWCSWNARLRPEPPRTQRELAKLVRSLQQ